MSNEEIVQKVQKFDENKMELIDLLWRQNEGLIVRCARQFEWAGELDDLKQECFFILLKAAEHYDRASGVKFSSYLWKCISWGLLRHINADGRTGHITQTALNGLKMMQNVIEDFREVYDRDPTITELSAITGLSKAKIRRLWSAYNVMKPLSLDRPLAENEDATLADTVSDPDRFTDAVIDRICNEELSASIWAAVDALPERNADIVRKRYQNGLTCRECGEALGISQQRVQQIIQESFRRIRNGKQGKELRAFLPEKVESIAIHNVGINSFRRYGSATEQAALKLLED